MSAWDDVQTEPVAEIEAGIFRQMEGRSNSDPCSPWADLALALCQRIATAERDAQAERDARSNAEARAAESDGWRHVAAYYLGDYVDTHSPVEARAEAGRRTIAESRAALRDEESETPGSEKP